jgi:hypothetical protein
LVELQKFGSLGRYIAKIETLEVELKIVLNFGGMGVKCNFPKENIILMEKGKPSPY